MKKRKKNTSDNGVINGFLNFLSDKIMLLLKGGFIGKIFLSSEELEKKAAEGVIVGPIDYAVSGEVSSYKRKNIKFADQSIFINLLRRVKAYLLSRELNWYGLYFFIFALYSLLIHFVKGFVLGEGSFFGRICYSVGVYNYCIHYFASMQRAIAGHGCAKSPCADVA